MFIPLLCIILAYVKILSSQMTGLDRAFLRITQASHPVSWVLEYSLTWRKEFFIISQIIRKSRESNEEE